MPLRFSLLLVTLCLSYAVQGYSAQLAVSVQAEAAIVINADTGVVLYEKNARKLHYPASTTKIATLLYALTRKGDRLDEMITAEQDSLGSTTAEAKLRSNFTLPPHWLENDGTHMGIKKRGAVELARSDVWVDARFRAMMLPM